MGTLITWDFSLISLKVGNFKSFGSPPQGFDAFPSFTIVVGRNNTGKSTLLDAISWLIANKSDVPQELLHRGNASIFEIEAPIPRECISPTFTPSWIHQDVLRKHLPAYEELIGLRFRWRLWHDDAFVSIENLREGKSTLNLLPDLASHLNKLAKALGNPFASKLFSRIRADRDIQPESDVDDRTLDENGVGCTNIIHNYLSRADFPSEVIERDLLAALNSVFEPDVKFTRISCQRINNGKWEVFFHEENKSRVSLSNSGSGLKTVILVLVNLLVLPKVQNADPGRFIFGFEELENNLHPALLRRLLSYVYSFATQSGAIVVLTSHSNVAIDQFSRKEHAQIVHVTHDGQQATCNRATTYVHNRGVLDDLDVKASDLLQSNGIIWVEGPSDRVYINQWIKLLSKGVLEEGNHYQCVFYGGRLLAHLSSDVPSDVEEAISLLRINRNCCIVIDSDKREPSASINGTKSRIRQEVEQVNGLAWVTEGREIENYLCANAVGRYLECSAVQVGQYESFREYLARQKANGEKEFKKSKAIFAEKIVPLLSDVECFEVLDLKVRVGKLCREIRKWNGLQD